MTRPEPVLASRGRVQTGREGAVGQGTSVRVTAARRARGDLMVLLAGCGVMRSCLLQGCVSPTEDVG